MYPRLLQLGHIAIPTYGALTALGLIAGLAAVVHFARRAGLDPNKLWSLCLLGVFTALLAVRLLLVAAHIRAFRQHPFWVLGLVNAQEAWITALSAAAGLGAALLYTLAEGLPVLAVMDALAPALALAASIERLGAFLAGLDYGRPALAGWSVTYTSRIAALWYRTPLGIPLLPVQLYQAAASLLILALLIWWLPRRTQAGELAGAWLFLYGLSSFFLSLLRAGASAISLPQGLAVAAVLAGGALWIRRRPTTQAKAAT